MIVVTARKSWRAWEGHVAPPCRVSLRSSQIGAIWRGCRCSKSIFKTRSRTDSNLKAAAILFCVTRHNSLIRTVISVPARRRMWPQPEPSRFFLQEKSPVFFQLYYNARSGSFSGDEEGEGLSDYPGRQGRNLCTWSSPPARTCHRIQLI
jgi:hypothetical protein